MSVLMTHFVLDAPPPAISPEHQARAMSEKLWIKPVKLSYDEILEQLERIGDDWHERSEHKNGRRAKTKKRLESSKTHTWMFMRGDEEIGLCIAIKKGFDDSLADRYNIAAQGTEIYKIGLFPAHQHDGLGHCFLPVIQIALLNGQEELPEQQIPKIVPSERIYLNTRDSNSTDSRGFYGKHGWQLVGEEVFVDYSKEGSELTHTLVPKEEVDPPIISEKEPRRYPLKPIGGALPIKGAAVN